MKSKEPEAMNNINKTRMGHNDNSPFMDVTGFASPS